MHRLIIISLLLFGWQTTALAQRGGGQRGGAEPGGETYTLTADSLPQEGVPKGTVSQLRWESSEIFPNTSRNYWIYVPAQYDPAGPPAAVMIFQDGASYVDVNGSWKIPNVFDNLINKGEMPVTIGVFIDPGQNRSFEYDTLSDQYARFLLEEILPEVGKSYHLTTNREGRAIAGLSSGGIAAFTVAWERPEEFSKVATFYGSFTAIAFRPARGDQPIQLGGDSYPALIRSTGSKPIKIFLQDGSNDLNNQFGNWFLANQQMLSAMEYANGRGGGRRGGAGGRGGRAGGGRAGGQPGAGGRAGGQPQLQGVYEINHEWGTGGHEASHGASIFPDIMRWMWAGYEPAKASEAANDAGSEPSDAQQ